MHPLPAALAQQSILSSPSFLGYLEYLQYFKQPRYARFIQYPQCLHHLELCVKSESFREAIRHDTTVGELAREQTEHWRTWREELESYPASATAAPPEPLQGEAVQALEAKES
jgi:mediator of RNA polymerase II transcription subunit 31